MPADEAQWEASRPRLRLHEETPVCALLVGGTSEQRHRLRVDFSAAGDQITIVGDIDADVASLTTCDRATVEAILLVADMHLPDNPATATLLAEIDEPLVVVSETKDLAAWALSIGAIDYLYDSLTSARLSHTVSRIVDTRESRLATEMLSHLRDTFDGYGISPHFVPKAERASEAGAGTHPVRIACREDGRVTYVRMTEVDWIEAAGNYVLVHARDKQFRLRLSLRALTTQLDRSRFRRIHRSTIVNMDRVREVQPWFGGDYVAILIDGSQLRVSRTFAPGLLRPLQ